MAARLNPYIQFDSNARDAMEYYQEVFGGTLNVSTFGEFGPPDNPDADKVMHAMLETEGGFTLMASDTGPGMSYEPGTNIAISLSGDDTERLRGYWSKLSEGGEVQVALEKQMWGDEFGQCVDRFGTKWMVNIAGDQQG